MVVKEHYWYFDQAISNSICNEIVNFGKIQNKQLGKIGKEKSSDLNLDIDYRNSNISWLNEPWIYKEIIPYINKANEMAKWNFNITQTETCQFTEYKLNQKYNWHQDGFSEPYNHPELGLDKITRKLSTVVSLSDSKDYTGGELEFCWFTNRREIHTQTCEQMLNRGSVIVFPSFVWHRVKPVLSGTRYSLVLWSCGPQWK